MMEVHKEELQTMMREFWAIDNNPNCLKASIIFLKRIGLTEKEIKLWIDFRPWEKEDYTITEEDENDYLEKLKDTQNYYSMEDFQ